MEEKKLDPEVRLNILGLKKEELVGLTINEQIKVL